MTHGDGRTADGERVLSCLMCSRNDLPYGNHMCKGCAAHEGVHDHWKANTARIKRWRPLCFGESHPKDQYNTDPCWECPWCDACEKGED